MAVPEALQTTPPSEEYDEVKCVAALAKLEHLKQQLDDLRLTIPRIVEPFYLPSKPPMFHAFKDTISKAQRDMKSFRVQWQGPEVQGILKHARTSTIADADLSAGAHIQQYGWIERYQKVKDASNHEVKDEERTEDCGNRITKQEQERTLKEWRQAHPTIKMVEESDGKQLLIPIVTDSLKFRFRITISEDPTTRQAVQVECEGTGEPFASVTRCLASRPNPNDLKQSLDMVAAYKTVRGFQCAKCKRMLDDDATKPVARRCRQTNGANETSETAWEPFHEGCLP